MEMSNRAYSLLDVKSVKEDERIIEGIASTPTVDRIGDIVEPMGAKFALPMPLLWQHDAKSPIGHVHFAKPTKDGIPFKAKIATIAEPGRLKERLDEAWQSVKAGLVRAVSIGFKSLEAEDMRSGGVHHKTWEWLELSLVTIPANADANIQTVKEYDTQQRAATGQSKLHRVVRLDPPGVTGKSQPKTHEECNSMNIAENITGLEAKLVSTRDRMEAALAKSIEEGRTADAAEQEEFDTAEQEVGAIEKQLSMLRTLEKHSAKAAKPVQHIQNEQSGSDVRGGSRIEVKMQPKLEPGIPWTRLVKVKLAAQLTHKPELEVARRMYGEDSSTYGEFKAFETKAAVAAGSNASGSWAEDVVSLVGAPFADFAEYLRPSTILGKFGMNGVPPLRRVPFYQALITQTGGGAAYWVGEGKPKPLTSFDWTRTTLNPLKIANIAVLTEENIRDSRPSSDALVRDSLRDAIAAGEDQAFIDPTNAGSANVKPAAITYGAETIASTGDDADDIRVDIRALFGKFIEANNPPSSAVWVMGSANALSLEMMVNPLGQPEFPGITMTGGQFRGRPVIVSDYLANNIVVLVNASDVFFADDGGIAVDVSREASLEMKDGSLTQDAIAGTGVAMVSMFQTNSVALRAEHTLNWKRRRDSAVAYLTSVDWGGEVPTV